MAWQTCGTPLDAPNAKKATSCPWKGQGGPRLKRARKPEHDLWSSCSENALPVLVEDPLEASPLCSKVALADSVEDPLEASPLCSKVALADSVEDPLEASPFCSKVSKGVPHVGQANVRHPPGGSCHIIYSTSERCRTLCRKLPFQR